MIVRSSDQPTEAAVLAVTRSSNGKNKQTSSDSAKPRRHSDDVLSHSVQHQSGVLDIQEEVELQKAMIKRQQEIQAQHNKADSFAKENPNATVTKLGFVKTIGVGTFGKINVVRLVKVRGKDSAKDGEAQEVLFGTKAFALKQVAKSNLMDSKRGLESAMTERHILSELKHPFLMNAFDTWQDRRYIYFLMDFASGGDLFSKLQKGELLSESRICLYLAEIALALDFLHSRNIIYRDMKAENVLIDHDGHIKLTDFGLSKYCPNTSQQGFLRAYTICGTPEYMAPELIETDGYGYGQKSDWWALGVLMFEMMYGFPPFYHEDPQEALHLILTADVEFPEIPEFSPQCKHVVSELLIKDEMSRLGNRHIFQHVFFSKFNLEDVYDKRINPEYVPQLEDEFDCSNFDEMHEEYEEKEASAQLVVDVPGFTWRSDMCCQP